MEKFRKFDDPRCGVNPFVPLIEKPRPNYLLIPRLVSLLKHDLSLFCSAILRVLILGQGAVYYFFTVLYADVFVLKVCCSRACPCQII